MTWEIINADAQVRSHMFFNYWCTLTLHHVSMNLTNKSHDTLYNVKLLSWNIFVLSSSMLAMLLWVLSICFTNEHSANLGPSCKNLPQHLALLACEFDFKYLKLYHYNFSTPDNLAQMSYLPFFYAILLHLFFYNLAPFQFNV